MATLQLEECPVALNICYSRGDSSAFQFVLTSQSTGDPIDITGFSFKLTVDPDPEPIDNTNNLFTLNGFILDAVNGIVGFQPTSFQSDQVPDVFYFDASWTDSGGAKRTFAKGKFQIKMDIDKS